jgi:hypothetical protein
MNKKKRVLEKTTENSVKDYALKKYGMKSIKLNLWGHRSMPDRMFWMPGGKPLLIEFKREGEVPTPLQTHAIEELRILGYDVHVADNKTDGIAIIESAVAAALASARLHEKRHETPNNPQRSRVIPGSRARKNLHNPSNA